jgi:hypothetical protein
VGVLAFLVAALLHTLYARATLAKAQAGHRSLFPTPATER